MPISANCPECLAALNLPDSLAGETVKCKECAALVNLPGGKARQWEEDEPEEEEMSEDKPQKKRARQAEDDRARSREKSKSDGSSPVVMVAVVFVVLLVVGVAVGIVAVAKSRSNRNGDDPFAKGSDTTPWPAPDKSITPIIPVVTRPPLPTGWVDFQHPQKDYSVYVPARPALREKAAQKPSQMHTNRVYVEETWVPRGPLDRPTSYAMVKMAGSQSALQLHYNSLTTPAMQNSLAPGGKCLVKPTTWGGRQALEVEIEAETIGTQTGTPGAKKSKSYMRYAMVGDKLYLFEVHENGGVLTESERLVFFDSVVFGR